jgi:aldose 1-epimerase
MCRARYEVEAVKDSVYNEMAFILRDNYTHSSARVIPALGNNLMSFVASLPGDQRPDVILGAPPTEAPGRASRWGNPILFPFPNRVRDARYSWEGKTYQLPVNTPEGNHIHGFVRDLPWLVDEAAGLQDSATLRCSIKGEDHPDIMRAYPFPFVLTVTYTLDGNVLQLDAEVHNTGGGALPMGFGTHPYFRLPLGSNGSRNDALVYVPSDVIWEQDGEKLATGQKIAVPPALDFSTEKALEETIIDHCYTALKRQDDKAVCWVRDSAAHTEVIVSFGSEFPDLVVLAPDDRSTIAFEPYTCVTDAINLAATIPDSGLIVLPPNQTWKGRIRFAVAPY